MNSASITVSEVSKAFTRGERCDSLYSLIARRVAHPITYRRRQLKGRFWALDGISFSVERGECLGVIGHNGAGKSTLLKLLAGIMRADRGTVSVNGRVSALIEVGAGFHPNLTGRENVYLNASILGIPRREATARFDAIVDFAGVREHIDAPLKHYSSGMHARLGFAIAIHAEPEVLLVDEVLSVGDQQFRSKCLEKMREFLSRGVAVVFVSHDLGTVQQFCDRTLVLSEGRCAFLGDSSEALSRYHRSLSESLLLADQNGHPLVEVSDIVLLNRSGMKIDHASPGELVALEYTLRFREAVAAPSYGLSLVRLRDRLTVYESSSTRLGFSADEVRPGESRRIRCTFTANVAPDDYAVGIHVRERDGLRYLFEDVELKRLPVLGEPNGEGPALLNFAGLAVQSDDGRSRRDPSTSPMAANAHLTRTA